MLNEKNILIVDDEERLRRSLIINFKEVFSKVFSAKDAGEAIEIISKNDVHVSLVDVRMPGVNGLELLRTFHMKKPQMVNIIYTAYGSKENLKEALKSRAYDFIEKPSSTEEIIKKISSALNLHEIEEIESNIYFNSKINDLNTDIMKKEAKIKELEVSKNENNTLLNIERNIKPLLKRIKRSCTGSQECKNLLNTLESNFENISTNFIKTFEDLNIKLTPTESKICFYLKAGESSKEISKIFGISSNTINVHIKNIRKKLGIVNKKVTLKNYLNNIN